jgi:hypothetical protein
MTANSGRDWVKQYLWQNLKPIYLNLFNPKNIELAQDNYIDADTFRTSDKKLYNLLKKEFNL